MLCHFVLFLYYHKLISTSALSDIVCISKSTLLPKEESMVVLVKSTCCTKRIAKFVSKTLKNILLHSDLYYYHLHISFDDKFQPVKIPVHFALNI